jgi:hypothetical protein
MPISSRMVSALCSISARPSSVSTSRAAQAASSIPYITRKIPYYEVAARDPPAMAIGFVARPRAPEDDPSELQPRMELYVRDEEGAERLPKRSFAVLREALPSGELERGRVPGLIGTSERTPRRVISALLEKRLWPCRRPSMHYRGDTMSHIPLTLERAAPGKPWVRFDGFAR